MSQQAVYVSRDNEIVYAPPYEQADTFLTAWSLPCPKAKQQAILDTQLNRCSGGQPFEYRPLLSQALLVLANIGKVSSLDGPASRMGWIPEVDICVWLLCGAFKMVDGKRELDHVVWYIPYIWVTTADTMATGREVFGYPKAIGWAQLPENPEDPGPLWADGLVLPTYSPESEVVQRRLFSLQRDPSAPSETPTKFGADQKREAFEAIAKKLFEVGEPACDWNLFISSFEDLLGAHLPMVFLKQFRSVSEPNAACYQAIIEANATINAFSGAGFLPGGWDLQLYSYASVDMPAQLGLEAKQRVDLGFYLYFSFSMDLGKEVWRFGATP
jgi:hypothetical protein